MEHMNRICKEAITCLGINKTESAIVRVGKWIGSVYPVLDQYDSENCVPERSIVRSVPRAKNMIINELKKVNVFSRIDSLRTYSRTSEQRTLWEHKFCPLFGGCPYLGGSPYFGFISCYIR